MKIGKWKSRFLDKSMFCALFFILNVRLDLVRITKYVHLIGFLCTQPWRLNYQFAAYRAVFVRGLQGFGLVLEKHHD